MVASKIDVLLGASVYSKIVESAILKGKENEPIAISTTFGWLLSGSLPGNTLNSSVTSLHIANNECLNETLQKFWLQEEVPQCSPYTAEEQACERHFTSTHTRDAEGRYEVRLPFKEGEPAPQRKLSDSFFRARAMLLKMEQRFEREPNLKTAYSDQIHDFLNLNHLALCGPLTPDEANNQFFLPHHGVWKESSTTTKLRTVFDGSAKTKSGVSINDLLHAGPNLLPLLLHLICVWRLYRYVFSADVEKMYRQIKVHPNDRKYQSIVWRDDLSQEILKFCIMVVAFGIVCSSFLAIRTVKQVACDHREKFPLGAEVAEKSTYMDDVLSGGHTIPQATEKVDQTLALFACGGFPLRKWVANDPRILKNLPPEILVSKSLQLQDLANGTSILGLSWNPQDDIFQFKISPLAPLKKITKRTILSRIAKLFDPLGWLAPTIVKGKLLMRELWLSKTGWDDPVSPDCLKLWNEWDAQLLDLNRISIPRWIHYSPEINFVEVHGFCDASKVAYGAAMYLRIGLNNESIVTLQTAKSKSAPIKWMGIPRLELSSAHLLARLAQSFIKGLSIVPSSVHLWTDSKIVLCWLSKAPSHWEVFVANRCSAIHELVPNAYWHHVRSRENPADLVSRGCSPEDLKESPLWWHGPQYLQESSQIWPTILDHEIKKKDLEEAKSSKALPVVASLTTSSESPYEWPPIVKNSSFFKALRITAYCFRFLEKLLKGIKSGRSFGLGFMKITKEKSETPQISAMEYERSKNFFVYLHQKKMFGVLSSKLAKGLSIDKSHSLTKLNPFFHNGLIRVGGRLRHAPLPFETKHPVLLYANDEISNWFIQEAHIRTMHGGIQTMLNLLRSRIWIVRDRLAVKTFINRCHTCSRWSKRSGVQMMGDLPSSRVTPDKPFNTAGVDYAGPFKLRLAKCRGKVTTKGYIAVFVCFVTHAVHLEMVEDYSSEAFISAFHRFTSRRGQCSNLHSDRGTTFVGADRELKDLFENYLSNSSKVSFELASVGTNWHFNPAGAPHFGGLWEAAVKSVKYHLLRAIGQQILTFVELTTLLCRIEAILNSRPLMALTDDVGDVQALTPAHFLIGRNSFLVPEPDCQQEKISPGQRYKLQSQILQTVWDRWTKDYLSTLQKRNKWQVPHECLKVGDLVIVKCETTSPGQWPLARVSQVHPGKDGLVRVVTLKTATSTLKRPIVKLISLKVSE